MLVEEKVVLGFKVGPTIPSKNSLLLSAIVMHYMLIEVLQEIFEEDSFLFLADILDKDSLSRSYRCFSTFHRISNTRALEQKVSSSNVDVVNRWKALEHTNDKIPSRQIKYYYTHLELLAYPFLQYINKM